jgi:hypothetical protein
MLVFSKNVMERCRWLKRSAPATGPKRRRRMSVREIEKEIIDPLTREEKQELFRYLARALEQEELLHYFTPGAVYEIGTPDISPNDTAFQAAAQLQKVLDQGTG